MLLHGASGYGASRIVFNGISLNEADQTIYTFSNVSLGAASPERIVIVAAYCGSVNIVDDGTPFSAAVSVGGISLLPFVYNNSNTNNYEMAIWFGRVQDGTSGDVVIEWEAGCTRCEIAVFSAYNQRWPTNESGNYDFTDYYAYDGSYFVNTTSGEMGTFEGGVDVFAAPYVRTYTGFDNLFAGTYISGGYQVSTGYVYRPFTVSSAIEERNIRYGGIALGP